MLQPIFWEKVAGGPLKVVSTLARPAVDTVARQLGRGAGSAIQRGRMRKFMPDAGAGKNTVIDVAGKAKSIQPVTQPVTQSAGKAEPIKQVLSPEVELNRWRFHTKSVPPQQIPSTSRFGTIDNHQYGREQLSLNDLLHGIIDPKVERRLSLMDRIQYKRKFNDSVDHMALATAERLERLQRIRELRSPAALVPAARGSTALAPSVRGSTELMPYAGGAGGGGKLPPGTATASGADDFLGGTRPFKPTGAETIIDPRKKFPWKRYLAGGAMAAGTGAGIYNAYQPEPGAAASLTNQLGPLAEASKPGLMEQLQGYGTSAIDWIKENPGLAAGGIGIPLLLYILSQQSRDDEKNASFAQQLGQQLARS